MKKEPQATAPATFGAVRLTLVLIENLLDFLLDWEQVSPGRFSFTFEAVMIEVIAADADNVADAQDKKQADLDGGMIG